jgi:hypothetical protein
VALVHCGVLPDSPEVALVLDQFGAGLGTPPVALGRITNDEFEQGLRQVVNLQILGRSALRQVIHLCRRKAGVLARPEVQQAQVAAPFDEAALARVLVAVRTTPTSGDPARLRTS